MEGPITTLSEPGIKAEGPLLRTLRGEVADLLNRRQESFPGAQPVSFSRRHLDELRQHDYYVVEKSDGIRYLLYLTVDDDGSEIHYLIDRRNDYWFLPSKSLHFPRKEDRQAFHTRTLVDGELVMDDMGGGRREPRFLVFDCLVLDGQNLMQRTLDKRIGYFQEEIEKPYKELFRQFPEERRYQPFVVEMKQMQFSYGIEMMFREVLPKLKHGNDGLIFTCRTSEYKHGTDQHILKWKAPQDNTIDCRLRLTFPLRQPDELDVEDGVGEPWTDFDAVPHAELYVFTGRGNNNSSDMGGSGGSNGANAGPWGSKYVRFDDLYLTEQEWEILKGLGDPLNRRIVECNRDEQGRWRLVRFRDDKPEANHTSTVDSVLESIRDRVTEQDLLDAAGGIKSNWKQRQAQEKATRK